MSTPWHDVVVDQSLPADRDAFLYWDAYTMLRDFMRRRDRDPWPIVENRWARIEQMNDKGLSVMGAIPGLNYEPESPLKVATLLLMAFEDFMESADLDSPYTLIHQLEARAAAWEQRFYSEEEADEDDEEDDDDTF